MTAPLCRKLVVILDLFEGFLKGLLKGFLKFPETILHNFRAGFEHVNLSTSLP